MAFVIIDPRRQNNKKISGRIKNSTIILCKSIVEVI